MIYESMPMMIFILAAGYLFTVYLLLALAKRTGKNSYGNSVPYNTKGTRKQEILARKEVTEAVNSP
jgi:hypothetical protein